MANTNRLKIILISSEGAIMPFLETLSAVNRCLVYEIGDLDEEQAMDYLLGKNMEQEVAKKVVSCVGGRLVYLQSCIKLHNLQKLSFNDDHVCKEIKMALFSRKLSAQRSAIEMTKPESSHIINALAECANVSPHDLIRGAPAKKEMNNAIRTLIDNNILRYDEAGNIKWYGKVQQDELAIIDGEREKEEE